ncbi:MAG: hypothetical protein H0W72_12330, partial [Planctomycetes bacterium]|nr:hypothetical protein [Planctomycetota bacterium]
MIVASRIRCSHRGPLPGTVPGCLPAGLLILTLLVVAHAPAVELGDGWQGRPAAGGRLVSVSFAGEDHGWAGGIGRLLTTSSGGRTWESRWDVERDGMYWFNNVASLGPSMAMASGFSYMRAGPGLVVRTEDGGATWTRVPVGGAPDASFTSLTFAADRTTGYLISSREGLFATGDGGRTWRGVSTPVEVSRCNIATLTTVAVVGAHLFVAGAAEILHSADGGAHWDVRPLPPGAANPHRQLSRVAFVTPERGWVSCFAGDSFQTDDGGVTWRAHDAPGTVFAEDAQHLWALADYEIFRSADAGRTWSKPTRIGGGRDRLAALCASGKRIHVVGGDEGTAGSFIADRAVDGSAADPLAHGIAPIQVEVPGDGYLTVQVLDARGRVVDQPVAGHPVKAGKQTIRWDLATMGDYWSPFRRTAPSQYQPPAGTPTVAEPGTYRWQGLWHPGMSLSYRTSFLPLVDAGSRAWLTPDGTGGWLGDHDAPRDAVRVGDSIWVGAFCEGGDSLLEADLDMRKRWGSTRIELACPKVLAADGGTVYYLEQGGWTGDRLVMIAVDAATKRARKLLSADVGPATYGDAGADGRPGAVDVQGLAVRGGLAYIADRGKQVLVVIDLTENLAGRSQALKTVAVLPLERPGRIRWFDDQRLAAVSAGAVVLIDARSRRVERLIDGLDQPLGLDVDGAGNVYVGEFGASHHVRVFDRSGTSLRTIGKRGKHRIGPYDRDNLETPGGIAVDAKGVVWVAEQGMTLKRTSRWDAQGRCVGEVIGPPDYGGAGDVHPEDPDRFFARGVEYRRDPRTGKVVVVKLLWRNDDERYDRFVVSRTPLDWPEASGQDAPPWKAFIPAPDHNFHGHMPAFPTMRGGKLYFSMFGGFYLSNISVLWVYNGDHLRPVAACGQPPPWVIERSGAKPADCGIFAWTDRNDDGRAQREEIVTAPFAPIGSVCGVRMNKDFAVAFSTPIGPVGIAFFPVASYTPQGYPVYALPSRFTPVEGQSTSDPHQVQNVMVDGSGQAIINGPYLTALRPDGTVAWSYRNRWTGLHSGLSATSLGIEPGVLTAPIRFYGGAVVRGGLGEIFCLGSNYGATDLFTTDGLYIARVFQDSRRHDAWRFDAPPTPEQLARVSLSQEHFGGSFQLVRDGSKDRYLYVTSGGSPHAAVVELDGLDRVKRLAGGSFTVTAEHYAQAQRLRQQRAAESLAPKRGSIVPVTGIVVDGRGAEWKPDTPKMAGIALGYDRANLYVLADLDDDRAVFANAATAANANEAFAHGDVVDVMLATDPSLPADRVDPGPGDLRLSLTLVDGQPTA